MAQARPSIAVHVAADTEYRLRAVVDDRTGSESPGEMFATIESGGLTIEFNYGWEPQAKIIAAIEVLRDQLAALSMLVQTEYAAWASTLDEKPEPGPDGDEDTRLRTKGAIAGLTPDEGDHYIRERIPA
jgi:hypothetical protein